MIKPEDLIRAEFSRAFLGYDMKEVDMLLDAVIEQMEAWEKERAEMLTALEYLLQEIEQYEHQADAAPEKQESDRALQAKKTARLAQDGVQAETSEAALRDKSKARMKPIPKPRREDPLPQPVAEKAEEMPSWISFAKAPSASAEPEFEIPTYVFAGESDATQTEEMTKTQDVLPVAEEFETAIETVSLLGMAEQPIEPETLSASEERGQLTAETEQSAEPIEQEA